VIIYKLETILLIDDDFTTNFLHQKIISKTEIDAPVTVVNNASEGICPSGWHIPSDGEFTELTDFLGGESVAGGKMKDDIQWNGTNSSGWSGLSGGIRYSGGFILDGCNGYWWSASESGSDSWGRQLNDSNDDVNRDFNSRSFGFSARCVRD